MTSLAPTLQAFFTDHLIGQRDVSPNTVAAYRDAFRLLLGFTQTVTGKSPADLSFDDLNAAHIAKFLDHLETSRGVTASTRNGRLAAIRSMFGFAALRHPEHAAVIQRVLAIPPKRTNQVLVTFLTSDETDALLKSPDRDTRTGRRDHAMLVFAAQTGLRVSELVAVQRNHVELGDRSHVRCTGKGRKNRITPLRPQTVDVLNTWLAERGGQPEDIVFPGPKGAALSRDAIRRLVTKHTTTAAEICPTLHDKNVTPHTLRHTAAMRLLEAGNHITVIALWLGHEDSRTTEIYLHADLGAKERALARTAPANTTPGRYQPDDPLLAFLDAL